MCFSISKIVSKYSSPVMAVRTISLSREHGRVSGFVSQRTSGTLHAHSEREDTVGGLHGVYPFFEWVLLCRELKWAGTEAWHHSDSVHFDLLGLAAKHCTLQIGVRAI